MISIKSTSVDITLDCDETAEWSLCVKGEKLDLSLEDYRVVLSLLPFLEFNKEVLLEQVQDTNARNSFPELTLIEAGLVNGSEYWSSCALGWLDCNEIEVVKRFESYLVCIYENKKKYGQSLRHKVKALLRLIE